MDVFLRGDCNDSTDCFCGGSFGCFSFLLKNENRLPCFEPFFAPAIEFAFLLLLFDIAALLSLLVVQQRNEFCRIKWQMVCRASSPLHPQRASVTSSSKSARSSTSTRHYVRPAITLVVCTLGTSTFGPVTYMRKANKLEIPL